SARTNTVVKTTSARSRSDRSTSVRAVLAPVVHGASQVGARAIICCSLSSLLRALLPLSPSGEGEAGLGGAPWPLRQRALQSQHWPAPSAGRLTRWKARERAWVWPAPLGALGAPSAGGGHRAGAHAPAGWGGRGRPRRGPAARRGETPRG